MGRVSCCGCLSDYGLLADVDLTGERDTLLTCRDAIVVLVGRAAGSFLGDVKCGLWCRVRV